MMTELQIAEIQQRRELMLANLAAQGGYNFTSEERAVMQKYDGVDVIGMLLEEVQTLRGYQRKVLRTCPEIMEFKDKLLLGAMGMAGETGEAVDLIKKVIFHGKPLDRERLIKEIGDVYWYAEVISAALGVNRWDIEAANVEKLLKRYPNGFSEEAANAPRTN